MHYANFKNPHVYFLDVLGLNKLDKLSLLRSKNNFIAYFRNQTIDRHIISEIMLYDCYNLKNYCKDNIYTIIDIGGQAGYFSVYAASLFRKAKIFTFEPEANNFILLRKNVEANNFAQTKYYNYGLSNKNGKFDLYLSSVNQSGHSLYPFEKNHKRQVIILQNIDDMWKKNKINSCDILKLDCEGAEYDIIYNMDKKKLRSIKHIIGEIHDIDNQYKNGAYFRDFLADNCFEVDLKLYSMIGNNVYLLKAVNLNKPVLQ